MSSFFISLVSIPLFLIAILLFRLSFKEAYGAFSKLISLGGILLFTAYIVFETAVHIYSGDELLSGLIWLCLGVAAIAGAFLLSAAHRRLSIQEDAYERANQRIFVITLVAYLMGLFLPPSVATQVESYCATEHRLDAEEIIDAVHRYQAAENNIPDDLDLLVPAYLKEIPSPECFFVYRPLVPVLTDADFLRSMDYSVMMRLIQLKKLDYRLKKCEWDEDDVHYVELYLLLPTIDLNEKDRYDFSLDLWERIPFSGGECSGSMQS